MSKRFFTDWTNKLLITVISFMFLQVTHQFSLEIAVVFGTTERHCLRVAGLVSNNLFKFGILIGTARTFVWRGPGNVFGL